MAAAVGVFLVGGVIVIIVVGQIGPLDDRRQVDRSGAEGRGIERTEG